MLILASVCVLAACGPSGWQADTNLPSCATETINNVAAGGYSVNLEIAAQQYPYNPVNCLTGVFQARASLTPFDIQFAPSQTNSQVLLYFELSDSQTNYLEPNIGEVITVPSSEIVANRSFYIDSYYVLPPWTLMQGPLYIKGNTLSDEPSGNLSFELDPNTEYEMVLYSVGP